jgi:hypothetical protein
VADLRNADGSEGLFGYASFPFSIGDDSDYDGVVINYKSFGDIGSGISDPRFAKGKTATHEVGHWAGLWHVFQGGCSETSCSTDGDEVCDTPAVRVPAWDDSYWSAGSCNRRYDCSRNIISAENYMDYNYDNCLNFFSAGQANRMRDMLHSYRYGIWSQSVFNTTPVACSTSDGGGGSGGGGGYCENGRYAAEKGIQLANPTQVISTFYGGGGDVAEWTKTHGRTKLACTYTKSGWSTLAGELTSLFGSSGLIKSANFKKGKEYILTTRIFYSEYDNQNPAPDYLDIIITNCPPSNYCGLECSPSVNYNCSQRIMRMTGESFKEADFRWRTYSTKFTAEDDFSHIWLYLRAAPRGYSLLVDDIFLYDINDFHNPRCENDLIYNSPPTNSYSEANYSISAKPNATPLIRAC